VKKGKAGMVKKLVDIIGSSDVNRVNADGDSPLILACKAESANCEDSAGKPVL